MLGKLEFTLPEEEQQFELASKASKLYAILWDFDQYIRGEIKYNAESLPESTLKKLEEIRDKFNNLCEDNAIRLYDMV